MSSSTIASPSARSWSLARAVDERVALAGVVLAGIAVRLIAIAGHATPRLFPDEYIYAALGRSLAEGRLEIRGEPARFPALLEPLLAAPAWLVGDVEVAFRLVQLLHAVAMPLAAIPVWLICRRLGLVRWERLACAASAVVLGLLYSAYLTADAIGYVLALAALAAGLRALDRPTAWTQVAFLGLAGLAAFARVQYVVIPAAFLVTALVQSNGRPLRAAARFRVVSGALAGCAALAFAAGPGRLLGYYEGVLDLDVGLDALRWAATDAVLAAFACGWLIVPAAAVGLVGALVRPQAAVERLFAVLAGSFALLVLVEAALYAANGAQRFQERYLLAVLPLALPFFFLGVRRTSRAGRIATALVAVALAAIATRLTLAEYAAGFGKQDSPFLLAVAWLEESVGPGEASLAVSAVAALAALAAAGAALARRGSALLVAGCLAATFAASAGAIAFDREASRGAADRTVAAEASWVDRVSAGPADLVVARGASKGLVLSQLFWNRSLERVALLGEAEPLDAFATVGARIDADGRLSIAGAPADRAFAVVGDGARLELEGARLLGSSSLGGLWTPTGVVRARLLVDGVYADGTLRPDTTVTVWPRGAQPRRGTLRLELRRLPGTSGRLTLTNGPATTTVQLHSGRSTHVELPVDTGPEPFRLLIEGAASVFAEGRPVAARLSSVTFEESSPRP